MTLTTTHKIAYTILATSVAFFAAIVIGTQTETTYNKNGIEVAQTSFFGSVSKCEMTFGTAHGLRDGYETALVTLKTKSATQLEVEAKYKGKTPTLGWVKSDEFGPIASIEHGKSIFRFAVLQEIADSNFFIVSAKHVGSGPRDNAPNIRVDGSDSLAASQAMADCMGQMK